MSHSYLPVTVVAETPLLMQIRLLFLNTRDTCGADVAVHLMLMNNFGPDEAQIFVLSNSEAADADDMRACFTQMPHVSARFLPFGRPADALAEKGKVGKAFSYVPTVMSLIKAAAFIRQQRIQVIHTTDRPRDASFAALLGQLTGVASIVHMHSNAGPHLSRLTLWGMNKATAIFAVSDAIKDSLGKMGLNTSKIRTIHNAVDTDHFVPEPASPAATAVRRQFGIPPDAPLLGIAARMIPWKGQRELIDAVARLRETYPDVHVLIVGAPVPEMIADYQNRACEGGIADRVHFAGFQKDVRPFLEAFDLFVHPSYEEPFGLAIVEAMAMGKPVIACHTGGVPEIITHGRDGWLVEPRSAEAVAAAIATLLDSPERRREIGLRARETVRCRFSPRQQCALAAQQYAAFVRPV